MSAFSLRVMQCPWCGRALWQVAELPGTPDFRSHAECFACGYRYAAKYDPVNGVMEHIRPGICDRLPDEDSDTVGPPDEIRPEHWHMIVQGSVAGPGMPMGLYTLAALDRRQHGLD